MATDSETAVTRQGRSTSVALPDQTSPHQTTKAQLISTSLSCHLTYTSFFVQSQ